MAWVHALLVLACVAATVCLLLAALYTLVVCVLPRRNSEKLRQAMAKIRAQGGPGELPELLSWYAWPVLWARLPCTNRRALCH